jgi:hypothetical protein
MAEPTLWTEDVSPARYDHRRVGVAPHEVPPDGDWYVMRTERWELGDGNKRIPSQKITQAVKYIRTRQNKDGRWPGLEVVKVRRNNDDGSIEWHMLGRWRTGLD